MEEKHLQKGANLAKPKKGEGKRGGVTDEANKGKILSSIDKRETDEISFTP